MSNNPTKDIIFTGLKYRPDILDYHKAIFMSRYLESAKEHHGYPFSNEDAAKLHQESEYPETAHDFFQGRRV